MFIICQMYIYIYTTCDTQYFINCLWSVPCTSNLTDCSLCPTGVPCNNVTGCEECDASYRPECTEGKINRLYFDMGFINE